MHERTPRDRVSKLPVLIGALLAAALLWTPPAAAHAKRHPRLHGAETHVGHGHGFPLPRGGSRVPEATRHHRSHRPRSYYRGRVYHAPHGHYHAVYLVPVQRKHVRVWVPHEYCRGELYLGGGHVGHTGPRLRLHIDF